MEGLMPLEPVSPPLTAVISHFLLPSSSPGLIRGAGRGQRGAACSGCCLPRVPNPGARLAGQGGAEGEQGSSTASSLI